MAGPHSQPRGLSSLIGVLLLVSVVVVAAGTLSLFALSYGEETTEVAPVAELEFEYSHFGDGVPKNDTVTIVHAGGDTLRRTRLEVVVGGDTVYNDTSDSESNSPTNEVEGLVVEVDGDEFNDLNKPGRLSPPDTVGGPPGDSDGSDPGVVLEWEKEVLAGQRLVIQERNAAKAYDVLQPGEHIRVVWHGDETTAVIAEDTVAPAEADD